MTITENVCGCGSATAANDAAASPCSCGCCGSAPETPATKEQRVAELRALKDNIDRELAELEHA